MAREEGVPVRDAKQLPLGEAPPLGVAGEGEGVPLAVALPEGTSLGDAAGVRDAPLERDTECDAEAEAVAGGTDGVAKGVPAGALLAPAEVLPNTVSVAHGVPVLPVA